MAKAKKNAKKARPAKKTAKKQLKKPKKAPVRQPKRQFKKQAKQVKKAARKPSKTSISKQASKPVMAKVITGKPNLLVTYDPNHKGIAAAEIKEAMARIGERYELEKTIVDGLFKIKTQDARRVVKKLAELYRREIQLLNTTHRFIPIDAWCRSEVPEMQKVIKGLVPNIGQNERWKMNIGKRHWEKMHGTELIIKLTEVIDRAKVDLEKPEKIVQVEIIGNEAGISLIRPDEMLEVTS
ncbi:THUMP domain-containing protein [Candidatus Woesearchaeota archaeon]|nr:THUMP domain-containing protein [Candidatus Woesearchaeota archaeon]